MAFGKHCEKDPHVTVPASTRSLPMSKKYCLFFLEWQQQKSDRAENVKHVTSGETDDSEVVSVVKFIQGKDKRVVSTFVHKPNSTEQN